MRTSLLVLLLAIAWSGIALAQVAAPSLNPTPTLSLMEPNPAVSPWDGPSRVGASYGTIKFDTPATTVNPDAKGNSMGLEAQYVGDMFAVGATQVSLSLDIDPSLGGGSLKTTTQVVQAGVQFAKRLSLGVSREMQKDTDPAGTNKQIATTWLGATVVFGERLYLGGAYGAETDKNKAVVPEVSVKRVARKMGIAYLWRDKDNGFHVEAYKRFAAAAVDSASVLPLDESDITGGTLEFVWSGLFFGYAQTKEKQHDVFGVAKDSTTSKTISLGWVPAQGLTLVANAFSNENNDPNTGATTGKASGTDIGVAWRF